MLQATVGMPGSGGGGGGSEGFSARGGTLVVHEWTGSGPKKLHVHHEDDEAWHVLAGVLRFRFVGGSLDVPAGGTVFVPAGLAHTYEALGDDARYLLILTPRIDELIREIQKTKDRSGDAELYRRYASEVVE